MRSEGPTKGAKAPRTPGYSVTLGHLRLHPHSLPLVSPCLAPHEVPFLPLSSDLPKPLTGSPQAPTRTPQAPVCHHFTGTATPAMPTPHSPLSLPLISPTSGPPGRVWRGCKGEWSPSVPCPAVTPAGPPASPAPTLPASGRLAGGWRCAGGPEDEEHCRHCSPAPTPRAQPPCRFPGLSTLGGPEPLTWNSRSSQVSQWGWGGPSVFPDIWGQQGPVLTLPVSLLYPPLLKAGLCPPSPKGSARVASVLSQCPGVDRAFPDDELSLAREAGGDWLALLLPFPVRKSLFNNHHKITNTGWWPGLGMGVTVGRPLEWRECSSTG